MSISDIARKVSRKGAINSSNNSVVLPILDFIESPIGLRFTDAQQGVSLFPVQKFILKAYYGHELDDKEKYLVIPKSWRYAQSAKPEHMYRFTEKEYMAYLHSEGRCNIKEIDHPRRELALAVGRRSGKCVNKNSRVYTEKGLISFEEMIRDSKDLAHLTDDDDRPYVIGVAQEGARTRAKTSHFYNRGFTKTIKVLTKFGYSLEGTPDHRVKVLGASGEVEWCYLRDLNSDTRIAIHRKVDLWPEKPYSLSEEYDAINDLRGYDVRWTYPHKWLGTRVLNDDLAYLLGLKFGDQLRSNGDSFLLRIRNAPDLLDNLKARLSKHKSKYIIHEPYEDHIRITGVGHMRELVQVLGYPDAYAPVPQDFKIPRCIRQSPKEVFLAFLRGLMETEALDMSDMKMRLHIQWRGFAEDLQLLLLNMGVLSALRKDPFKGTFTLQIRDAHSAHILLDAVGTEGMSRGYLDKTQAYHGFCKATVGASPDFDAYYFDEVKTLTDSEAHTCDFEVPGNHEYVCQGMTNHNSAISGMIATYEIYKTLRKVNPQRYFGLKPHDSIKICFVAPSLDQAKLIYQEVRKHSKNCDYMKSFLAKDTQSEILFQTPYDRDATGAFDKGGMASVGVAFYSSNAGNLRGHNNYVVILDEFAFFPTDGVTSDEQVYQSLTPSTAAFSPKDPTNPRQSIGAVESRIIMISSPFAKSGLFHEKFQIAMSGLQGSEDIFMVQAPTWEVNPTVPADYYRGEYNRSPEKFMCEFGAEFSDSIKSWIDDQEAFKRCIDPDLRPETRGRPKQHHFLGLDLGLKEDRTSVVLTRPEDDRIKLVYHEEWQASAKWTDLNPHLVEPLHPYAKTLESVEVLDFDAITEWIEELSRRFYIEEGMFDQYSGYALEQALKKKGLGRIHTEKFSSIESSSMFESWKQMMYYEKHWLYNYPSDMNAQTSEKFAPYLKELLELEARKVSKHIIDVQAPQIRGKHDDFSDAYIRSAWLSMQKVSSGPRQILGSSVAGASNNGVANPTVNHLAAQRRKMMQHGIGDIRRMVPRGRRIR